MAKRWRSGMRERAKEDYIPAPYDKHFKWEASMDQDDYICKHCGEMMMTRDGSNALHTAPESEIIEVVKQHLLTHNIVESYADEEIDEKKFTPPKIHYHKQYPFGRQQKGFFGEDLNSELNPDNKCGMCGRTFNTREELEDHAYSLGPHNRTTIGETEEDEYPPQKECPICGDDEYIGGIRDHMMYKHNEVLATEVEHEKCPHCNFETSWKEGDLWQADDAKTEMNNHIVTHGTTEARATETSVVCPNCGSVADKEHVEGEKFRCKDCGVVSDYGVDFDKDVTGESYVVQLESGHDYSPDRKRVFDNEEEARKYEYELKMSNFDNPYDIPVLFSKEAYAREYQVMCEHCGSTFDLKPDLKCEYCGKVNDSYASAFEAYYGYGSATGRMPPAESWNQGYLPTGDLLDSAPIPAVFEEFRQLSWSELPADIQELWKNEASYRPSGEAIANEADVDALYDEWNHGPLLDRDTTDPVEYMNTVNWWLFAEAHGLSKEEADAKMKLETGESKSNERDIGWSNAQVNDQAWQIMAEQEFNKKVEDLTAAEYTWIEQLMNDYGNTMKPEDKPKGESFATEDYSDGFYTPYEMRGRYGLDQMDTDAWSHYRCKTCGSDAFVGDDAEDQQAMIEHQKSHGIGESVAREEYMPEKWDYNDWYFGNNWTGMNRSTRENAISNSSYSVDSSWAGTDNWLDIPEDIRKKISYVGYSPESYANEEEVPWDRSEGDRARDELRNQDSVFVTEEDPDFENDPDYQGFVDDVKVEPSQYTQSGMDKEEKNRGDIDNDALEAKATEGQYKSFVCDKTFDVGDSRDFHDSMHLSNSDDHGFGYKTINGKCVTTTEYDELGGE